MNTLIPTMVIVKWWCCNCKALRRGTLNAHNWHLSSSVHPPIGWVDLLHSLLFGRHIGRTCKRYIPSEKIGQFFWPPRNGFFGINYHQWTWGNAFWPFLAPPDPWGVSGGVGGGQGGSVGPKFSTFCGATFGFQNVKFWIVWTENTLFSRFLAKNSPSGGQKWPFFG